MHILNEYLVLKILLVALLRNFIYQNIDKTSNSSDFLSVIPNFIYIVK
jgi:hypothetical protein